MFAYEKLSFCSQRVESEETGYRAALLPYSRILRATILSETRNMSATSLLENRSLRKYTAYGIPRNETKRNKMKNKKKTIKKYYTGVRE